MLHLYRKKGNYCFEDCKLASKLAFCGIQSLKQDYRHQNHTLFSSFTQFPNKQDNHRPVSINVLVRSIVSIIQKTDQWDSLLTRLCIISSSQITPRIAVQVIKRIRKPDTAFKFFEWLEKDCDGFRHDSLTYSAMFQVLAKGSRLSHAQVSDSLFRKKIDLGFDVTPMDFEFVLRQWVKVGKLGNALGLLDEMRSRGFVPSCSSCNVLLQGLFKSKRTDSGLEVFHEMREGWVGVVDTQSFNIVMKADCVGGRVGEAFELFNAMKEKDCRPDLDSFNILIKGFSERGDAHMICSLFRQMFDLKIKPDSYTMNLLIKELCKQGRPECGNDLFNYMRKVGWIDKKFVYTQLVDSLCNYGWWLKALKVFVKMVRKGHHPKVSLYSNLVRRLCMGDRIRQAYRLKDLMEKKGFISEIEIYNALMDGVCLAGRMDMADKLLREFQHKGLQPELHTWNVLLRGQCRANNVAGVLRIMEKIKETSMVPELGPCNDLINNLMIEKKAEEVMQLKKCIELFQKTNCDTETASGNELYNNLVNADFNRSAG